MKVSDALNKRSEGQTWSRSLLKGRDLSPLTESISVAVEAVIPAPPNFTGVAVVMFKKPVLNGRTAWAVNVSNARAMAAAGFDDLDLLAGKEILLRRTMQLNPQNNQMVPSLIFAGVIPTPNGSNGKKPRK